MSKRPLTPITKSSIRLGARKMAQGYHFVTVAELLALNGVVDIIGTKINGQTNNIPLDPDSVAVRGTFTNA